MMAMPIVCHTAERAGDTNFDGGGMAELGNFPGSGGYKPHHCLYSLPDPNGGSGDGYRGSGGGAELLPKPPVDAGAAATDDRALTPPPTAMVDKAAYRQRLASE